MSLKQEQSLVLPGDDAKCRARGATPPEARCLQSLAYSAELPPCLRAVRVANVVEENPAWLEYAAKLCVKLLAVHIRRLAQRTGGRIVNDGGELAIVHVADQVAAVSSAHFNLAAGEQLLAPRVVPAHLDGYLIQLDSDHAGHPGAARRLDGRVAEPRARIEDTPRQPLLPSRRRHVACRCGDLVLGVHERVHHLLLVATTDAVHREAPEDHRGRARGLEWGMRSENFQWKNLNRRSYVKKIHP